MRNQLSYQQILRAFIQRACARGCKCHFTSKSPEVKNTWVYLPLVFFFRDW